MNRRGVTWLETMIIFVAALLTVAAFSFLVVTLGFRSPEENRLTVNEILLPVIVSIPEVLANVTDPEFMDFFDYVFGTREKINGVFDSDFTSLRID